MPASTMDPITSVLKNAFNGAAKTIRDSSPSTSSRLESGILSGARKAQISASPVVFENPVKHIGAGINAIKKTGFILLNPTAKRQDDTATELENGHVTKQSNGTAPASNGSLPTQPSPPVPKIVFYSPSSIEVTYLSHRVPGAGMFNMGNTCYLNSTLQALFHTPAMFNYLMSGAHNKQCKSINGFLHNCLVCALTATLKETLHTNVMRPSKIYEKLKLICKHFMHGRQEDAHEFLRYLIESLQRSFLNSCHVPKNLDNASKETTPFNQIFGGYLRQDVTCLQCKYVSITFQHFMDLLLDIRQASNIDEALNLHFRAERLGNSDSGNMYKCEKCKTKVPAKKKCFIARPPVVLCIQLKRFSLLGGKISKPVQLSRRIDIGQYMKQSSPQPVKLQYRLVSMITHVGPSPNCGHYTAIGEAANEQFYQFDDSSVRPVSANQALNTASYVVLYEMTKPSKKAWIDDAEALGKFETNVSASKLDHLKTSSARAPCTATSTSNSVLKQTTLESVPNKPALIPLSAKNQPVSSGSSIKVSDGPNKIGVLVNKSDSANLNKKKSLVPYDTNGESDDDDNCGPRKNSLTSLSGPVGTKPSVSSSFVPRSVTMNVIKRNQDTTKPGTPSKSRETSGERPSSVASNPILITEVLTETTPSRSGLWNVSDADQHNPSINSDSSGHSTTGNWRVTNVDNEHVGQKSHRSTTTTTTSAANTSTSVTASHNAGSSMSTGSNIARVARRKEATKRGSSIEDYDAELDRGRTKKAKKRHSPSPVIKRESNPFQNAQSQMYNQKETSNGNSIPARRASNDSVTSSSSYKTKDYHHQSDYRNGHHRDNQRHGFRHHRDDRHHRDNRHHRSDFRRSHSSSSLYNRDDDHRDKYRKRSGSGFRPFYESNRHRDHHAARRHSHHQHHHNHNRYRN